MGLKECPENDNEFAQVRLKAQEAMKCTICYTPFCFQDSRGRCSP